MKNTKSKGSKSMDAKDGSMNPKSKVNKWGQTSIGAGVKRSTVVENIDRKNC